MGAAEYVLLQNACFISAETCATATLAIPKSCGVKEASSRYL
jgi:hypothetical protein